MLAVAQLMVVFDSSIVNIALPSAQHQLGISDADRQWIITAYTLTFGGLLLLGGRLADFAGRKRVFVGGVLGFACASALGGFAPNATVLFVARGLQGACGALLAPACLSLIAVTFTYSRDRAHAFAVYAGVSGGGAALGLILGGALTQYASWRWCLLINVPLALVVAVLALFMVAESRARGRARYDFPGAITVTLALVILVYGFNRSEVEGWLSATAIGCLVGAGLLFLLFVLIELRTSEPLLPMRLLWERNRGGAYLVSLLAGVGLFGTLLLMSYYLQEVLRYSALQSGLAFLPFSAGTIVSSAVGSRLLHHLGPRFLMTVGLVAGAVGMFLLAQLRVDSSLSATCSRLR